MLLRSFAPLTLAWAAIALAPAAWGQGTSGVAPAPPSEVRAWLLRIHDAASRRNFQGTFVVSGVAGVASARIAHFCEGPNQYERIESLDGRQRQVYRYNDVVHTVWPGSHVAMVEQRGLLSSFPALLQAGDDGIAEWYEVRSDGIERVAGHEADVLAVKCGQMEFTWGDGKDLIAADDARTRYLAALRALDANENDGFHECPFFPRRARTHSGKSFSCCSPP